MTHDNLIRVGVPIHNDQNNTSIEELVDAHTLEVYNPKSCACS